MTTTVQIRLIAATQDEAAAASQALRDAAGSARLSLAPPQEGRRGQWLVYGSFAFVAPADLAADVERQLAGAGRLVARARAFGRRRR